MGILVKKRGGSIALSNLIVKYVGEHNGPEKRYCL